MHTNTLSSHSHHTLMDPDGWPRLLADDSIWPQRLNLCESCRWWLGEVRWRGLYKSYPNRYHMDHASVCWTCNGIALISSALEWSPKSHRKSTLTDCLPKPALEIVVTVETARLLYLPNYTFNHTFDTWHGEFQSTCRSKDIWYRA